ncbi:MAG: hypothetical protein KKC68_06640 [Candidatus Thermoplasmatota archaeon]|nr:hypothetical protein [Candidatus Thermoplasmatota archaeon]
MYRRRKYTPEQDQQSWSGKQQPWEELNSTPQEEPVGNKVNPKKKRKM